VAHVIAAEPVSYQAQFSVVTKWQEAIIDELDNMRKNRVLLRVQSKRIGSPSDANGYSK
jgi:hypothetical protein